MLLFFFHICLSIFLYTEKNEITPVWCGAVWSICHLWENCSCYKKGGNRGLYLSLSFFFERNTTLHSITNLQPADKYITWLKWFAQLEVVPGLFSMSSRCPCPAASARPFLIVVAMIYRLASPSCIGKRGQIYQSNKEATLFFVFIQPRRGLHGIVSKRISNRHPIQAGHHYQRKCSVAAR